MNKAEHQIQRKERYHIGYIFMVFHTVITSIAIITMAWTIPMTLRTKKAYKEAGTSNEDTHKALAIWALLICGLLAGIFILLATIDAEDSGFKPEESKKIEKKIKVKKPVHVASKKSIMIFSMISSSILMVMFIAGLAAGWHIFSPNGINSLIDNGKYELGINISPNFFTVATYIALALCFASAVMGYIYPFLKKQAIQYKLALTVLILSSIALVLFLIVYWCFFGVAIYYEFGQWVGYLGWIWFAFLFWIGGSLQVASSARAVKAYKSA